MKATQENLFQPITLVIESKAELDYLYAISNMSITEAVESARSLDFELSSEAKLVQMPFYSTIQSFR